MKQFFGAFFGSVLGLIIASIIGSLIIVAGLTSAFKGMKQEDRPSKKGQLVLTLEMDGEILDREKENPFEKFKIGPMGDEYGMGLNKLMENLEKAKEDTVVKGIYINMKPVMAGRATLKELRDAILDFKKSGKFVIAYSEYYTQNSYYLASAADKVYLNPQGAVDWKGLAMNIMFYKKTLEKLGIEAQIFRHGKFKSAIEPFIYEKMSNENRLQSRTFLTSLWNTTVNEISETRKITKADLNKYADELSVNMASDALDLKLVDGLKYEDEVLDEIKEKLKIAEKEKINFVSHADYSKHRGKKKEKTTDEIAVIYAIGQISSGEGDDKEIGSETTAEAIKDARLNEKVKAIVLRVNSPGGSALASDVIWREVVLAKKVKPVIVSMGNVAASGGYYISCAADRIFAEPNTITGSIGVFGMIPNLKKAFEDKLGITTDTVKTNKHSDMMNLTRAVAPTESVVIQKSVEKVYDVFISRVAEGRNISKEQVDSIGQGRVWSGSDALKIGLVDELGGLKEAIAFAAKKADLKSYKTKELPVQKGPFDDLFGKIESETEARMIKKSIGEYYTYWKHIKSLCLTKGVYARMPFDLIIE